MSAELLFLFEPCREPVGASALRAAFLAAARARSTTEVVAMCESLPKNCEQAEALYKLGRAQIFLTWATRDLLALPPPFHQENLKESWWRNADRDAYRPTDLALGLRYLIEARDCAVRALQLAESDHPGFPESSNSSTTSNSSGRKAET